MNATAHQCLLSNGCPVNGPSCTTFTHEGYQGGVLFVPASVLNDTHALCLLPPVITPGPGLVLLCAGNSAVSCGVSPTNTVELRYYKAADVVVGLRPYLGENEGTLLVTTDPTLEGVPLQISAWLPFANRTWKWALTPSSNGSAVLVFDITALPATVNADLQIQISGVPNQPTFKIWRRFMKAPPAPSSVQVDRHSRSLRVNGELFAASGWFMGVPTWPPLTYQHANVSVWLDTIRPRAGLGTLNWMMPYKLNTLLPSTQRAFLDACAVLGVKVMYPMHELGFTALGGMNYATDWAGEYA
jgi:hypothetical protein